MNSTQKKRHVIITWIVFGQDNITIRFVLLQVSFLGAFISGASSGACSTVLFQPFDVVKTRLQENAAHLTNKSTQNRYDDLNTVLIKFLIISCLFCGFLSRGMMQIFSHIVRKEGPKTLWSGLIPVLPCYEITVFY
jgi:hypothetical protein